MRIVMTVYSVTVLKPARMETVWLGILPAGLSCVMKTPIPVLIAWWMMIVMTG
jgi:hypothetical protein